jgi:acyl dehydratase
MTIKYYWEDFVPGQTVEFGRKTVTREEMLAFSRQFDPQPFHVDEQAAAQSLYGGLIASGWHTCALLMRTMCDGYLLESASLGSPGLDNIRWLKPVRPGDTLRMTRTVVESRPSGSRPDMGLVKVSWEVFNQKDEKVMTVEGMQMFRRRPQGGA